VSEKVDPTESSEARNEFFALKEDPLWKSLPQEVKPKVRRLIEQVAYSQTRQTVVSGPLPASDELAKYEQIAPGAANRLITLVEQQSSHRISIETFVIKSQQWQSFAGQILGFLVAIAFLVGAVYTVVHGFAIAGTIIGSLDLIGLVTVFVLGRNTQKQNLMDKRS
jgi:uncharacterized membrane protein